jgi:NitT/TauT family transport system substrate-binding protein
MRLGGKWIVAAAAACLVVAGAARAGEARKVTVAAPGAALHFYPFYVADKGGFFTKEGLAIDWVNVGGGSREIAAVAGGSADMAVVGMQPAISAREHGADLVAIGKLFDTYAMELVLSNAALSKTGIKPDMPIDEKVKRLKGVTIGVTGIGSTTDVILRSWLMKRGLNPQGRVAIQPLGNPAAMFAAFQHGIIDGFVLGAPWPEEAEARHLGKVVIDVVKGEVPELRGVPYTAVIMRGAYVKAHPDIAKSVDRALADAMKFTKEHPDKAQALLKAYFPKTDEAVYKTFEPAYRASAAETPVISKDDYARLQKWVAITSDKPITVSYDDFVVDRYAKEAAAEVLGK